MSWFCSYLLQQTDNKVLLHRWVTSCIIEIASGKKIQLKIEQNTSLGRNLCCYNFMKFWCNLLSNLSIIVQTTWKEVKTPTTFKHNPSRFWMGTFFKSSRWNCFSCVFSVFHKCMISIGSFLYYWFTVTTSQNNYIFL